jgi:hypothetical protein
LQQQIPSYTFKPQRLTDIQPKIVAILIFLCE